MSNQVRTRARTETDAYTDSLLFVCLMSRKLYELHSAGVVLFVTELVVLRGEVSIVFVIVSVTTNSCSDVKRTSAPD